MKDDKKFFQDHQKVLLFLFNFRFFRNWMGVPPSFKGYVVKVTPNTIHRFIRMLPDGRVEVEMIAMIGQPIFAKELQKAINRALSVFSILPRFVIHFPLPVPQFAFALTSTDFGTGSGDGDVGNSKIGGPATQAGYDTCRNAGTGNDSQTGTNGIRIQGNRLNSGTDFYIYRGFLPADTSAIGSGSTISSAEMHFFNIGDLTYTGTNTMCCMATTQASTSSLATSDFNQVSSVSLGTVSVGGQDAAGTAYVITISSPDTNISKTSITKLGIREKPHDNDDLAPSVDTTDRFCSSEHATSSFRPFYRVVYAAAGGSVTPIPTLLFLNVG